MGEPGWARRDGVSFYRIHCGLKRISGSFPVGPQRIRTSNVAGGQGQPFFFVGCIPLSGPRCLDRRFDRTCILSGSVYRLVRDASFDVKWKYKDGHRVVRGSLQSAHPARRERSCVIGICRPPSRTVLSLLQKPGTEVLYGAPLCNEEDN